MGSGSGVGAGEGVGAGSADEVLPEPDEAFVCEPEVDADAALESVCEGVAGVCVSDVSFAGAFAESASESTSLELSGLAEGTSVCVVGG